MSNPGHWHEAHYAIEHIRAGDRRSRDPGGGRRHREAGTLLDENRKLGEHVLGELGEAGYWGFLVDREYGGSGVTFTQFARFLVPAANT